jgi:hypothetical protein
MVNCSWYYNPNWKVLGKAASAWTLNTLTKIPNTKYQEPCQGSAWDCRLIAAISAVLWVNKYPLSITLEALGNGGNPSTWSVTFFDNARAPYKVYVTDKMCCDSSNTLEWAFNGSNSVDIWPGLIEKAYAATCSHLSSSSSLPIDNPAWPCSSTTNPPFGSGFKDYDGKTDHRLVKYTSLTTLTTNIPNIKTAFAATGKVLYSAIAITPSSPISPPPGIVGDHAYTILSKSGSNITMRDPKANTTVTIANTYFDNNNVFSSVEYIT